MLKKILCACNNDGDALPSRPHTNPKHSQTVMEKNPLAFLPSELNNNFIKDGLSFCCVVRF